MVQEIVVFWMFMIQKNNIIYDFKFGKNPKMGQPQINKYQRNFPGNKVVPIKMPVKR